MPDSPQKILINIASVSQRVANVLVHQAGHKTVETFQLDRIVVSSNAILGALSFPAQCMMDDRLEDWLASEEPRICLDALNQMMVLLDARPRHGKKGFLHMSRSAPVKSDIGVQAIRLFQKYRDCFHFLLTTEIWSHTQHAQAISPPQMEPTVEAIGRRDRAPTTQTVEQMPTRGIDRTKNELDNVLRWLNAWKSMDTHERTITWRQPGTCTWLPDTSVYETWRATKDSFLWLNGKPGAGKSVLAASVIEHLQGTLQDREVVVFFYCDFRDERSTSASEVMRSILSQLLQQHDHGMANFDELISELIKQKDNVPSTISNVTRLAHYISLAAELFSQQPFIVVDALDECNDVEGLLSALTELNRGGVRLFVTSRPLQVIKDSFLNLPSISMDAMKYEVMMDIGLHVGRELDSHRRLRILDPGLKQEITSALCAKADGMFRWVQCQLTALKRCVTTVRIREALRSLPSDLSTTYDRILLMIDKNEEEKVVRRALEWLVVTLRPLKLSQVLESFSIDLEHHIIDVESTVAHGFALLDALGSLVTYNESTDVVALSHFSVKEYLIGELVRTQHPAYHINEQAAHTQLALLCMCYIGAYMKYNQQPSGNGQPPHNPYGRTTRPDRLDVIPSRTTSPSSLPSSRPLLKYVQGAGFYHLSYVDPESRAVLHAIQTLASNVQQHPLEWEQLREEASSSGILWPSSKDDLVLYILVVFASEPLLRSYIAHSGPKLILKDGINPLIYAADYNRVEHAKTLLSNGVNPNRKGWAHHLDSRQVLPLEVAANAGRLDLVDLFLEEGCHIPDELFIKVLKKLSSNFLDPILTRLLQTDHFVEWAVDVRDNSDSRLLHVLDPTGYLNHTLWHQASVQDFNVIQERIVQIGCSRYSHFDGTSLRHAASAGHISTVKCMLASNVPLPSDILLHASCNRTLNTAMLCLFLNEGCDVHVISPGGNTVLHYAMKVHQWTRLPDNVCLKSIQILIDAGCNPSMPNLDGDTAFHFAVQFGYISVIDCFLSRGATLPADVLLVTPYPQTTSIIHFLLQQGADINAMAANGDTPLHSFLRLADYVFIDPNECLGCIKLLIDAGCDPHLTNAAGETPLDIAAANGHILVVKYFLSLNLLPSSAILLSVASASRITCGGSTISRILIDEGADIHVTCPNGDTLLHLSTDVDNEGDCLQRIKTLVDAGCDPCVPNAAGVTPLHIAACRQFISVMEYLISVGTPLPPDIMLVVLRPSAWKSYQKQSYMAVRFLLDRQSDIHVLSENGDSLLHLAAGLPMEVDAFEVAKLLVSAGCSPHILNSALETPLHAAAESGYKSVIDYLLSADTSLPPDILLAASRGHSRKAQFIRFLIDKGANACTVSTSGDTPLHLILAEGDEDDRLECFKILLGAGCDPRAQNKHGKTALHGAATRGFISILEYLLSRDIPLPYDISLASTRTIRFLLERGIDVWSHATNYGDAAGLMERTVFAHDDDYLNCAGFLIWLGWDFSSRDSTGQTAIHVVVKHGDLRTLKYLLSQHLPLPADILLATIPSEEDPCIDSTTVRLVRLLILEGARDTHTTHDGDTLLHLALRSSFEGTLSSGGSKYHDLHDHNANLCKLVEILLNNGADPYAQNVRGQTPLDLAEAKGHFFQENFLRLIQKSLARRPSS